MPDRGKRAWLQEQDGPQVSLCINKRRFRAWPNNGWLTSKPMGTDLDHPESTVPQFWDYGQWLA